MPTEVSVGMGNQASICVPGIIERAVVEFQAHPHVVDERRQRDEHHHGHDDVERRRRRTRGGRCPAEHLVGLPSRAGHLARRLSRRRGGRNRFLPQAAQLREQTGQLSAERAIRYVRYRHGTERPPGPPNPAALGRATVRRSLGPVRAHGRRASCPRARRVRGCRSV